MHQAKKTVAATIWLVAALVPAVALAFSVTTSPQKSQTIKRYSTSKVYYHLHPKCSADLPVAKCLDILREGFDAWMEPSCGSLKFVEGYHCNLASKTCLFDKKYGKAVKCEKDEDCPAKSNLKVMPMGYNPNKRNELVFVEGNTWKMGSFVLGVTVAWSSNWNGTITESDIAFNGLHHKWTTNPFAAAKNLQDLLSVTVHEQGHFFGVHHVLGNFDMTDLPTMAPNVFPKGISQTLSVDDKRAICFLNPKGGTYTCKNDDECPYIVHKSSQTGQEKYSAKMVCKSSKCVWGNVSSAPKAALGGNCSDNDGCQAGLFCQPYGAQAYCSKTCNTKTKNCPSSFTCFGYKNSSTGQGACLPEQGGNQTGKAAGDSCNDSSECASLMCLQGVCRVPCNGSNAADKCNLAIEVCTPVPGTNTGVCMSKTSSSGKKALGQECFGPEECDSNLCMKDDMAATVGYCRQSCTGPNTCPIKYHCVQQVAGYQGCLPGSEKLPTGSPCKYTIDCSEGPCIKNDQGGTFCTSKCTLGDAASCPCGMECKDTAAGTRCYVGQPQGCLETDANCGTGSECASGLCTGGACRAMCDVLTDPLTAGCALGEGCVRVAPGSKAGMCWPPGTEADGAECTDDKLCKGLLCAQDTAAAGALRCMKACAPDSKTCGDGKKCAPLSKEIGICQTDAADPTQDTVGGADAGGFVPATMPQQPAPSSGGCTASPDGGAAAGFALLLLAAMGLTRRRRRARKAL